MRGGRIKIDSHGSSLNQKKEMIKGNGDRKKFDITWGGRRRHPIPLVFQ